MRPAGEAETIAAPRARFAALDVARGAALCAMIVYHFAWDLWWLGFVAVEVPYDPAWRAFARAIAGSFLLLVGASLVLAHESGIAAAPFLRRLATIAGAAALVSAVTWFAFPETFIYFGILHMIAAASVLALPFLRLHPAATLAAAACVLAAPFLWSSPAFDTRWLAWIGFFETPPPSNDFEPIFPWLAPTLVGVALMRIALASRLRERLAAVRAQGAPARLLVAMGRRSLLVYLVHQPILLGILVPLAWLVEPQARPPAEAFVAQCRASCVETGRDGDVCAAACACVADELARADLGPLLARLPVSEAEQAALEEIARGCFQRGADPGR